MLTEPNISYPDKEIIENLKIITYDNLIKEIEKQLESEEQKAGFRKGSDALVVALSEMPFDKMCDVLMERYRELEK